MHTDTDTDTDWRWVGALYLGALIVLPTAIYFRAELHTDPRTVAPLLAYCVLVAWFRPRVAS